MNGPSSPGPGDLQQLGLAKRLLENPSLAVRITAILGKPLEKSVAMLPARAAEAIRAIVRGALGRALDFATATMANESKAVSSDRLHKMATFTTGAVGGLFGLPGLAVELPLTTVIMLRSIGDIARSEGHDLQSPDTRIACLEVFALGGKAAGDDAADTGYYAVRAALAKLATEAAQHLASKGAAGRGSPVLLRLIETIAARFGLVVEEKVALEFIPVIGAVSGALINSVFMDHFQGTARGHFIVKRLEAVYGADVVRRAYEGL